MDAARVDAARVEAAVVDSGHQHYSFPSRRFSDSREPVRSLHAWALVGAPFDKVYTIGIVDCSLLAIAHTSARIRDQTPKMY